MSTQPNVALFCSVQPTSGPLDVSRSLISMDHRPRIQDMPTISKSSPMVLATAHAVPIMDARGENCYAFQFGSSSPWSSHILLLLERSLRHTSSSSLDMQQCRSPVLSGLEPHSDNTMDTRITFVPDAAYIPSPSTIVPEIHVHQPFPKSLSDTLMGRLQGCNALKRRCNIVRCKLFSS